MAFTMEDAKEEESQLLAMQMVSASVLPMVLKAAVELQVFDIIAEAGPDARLSPLDIAFRLPTRNPNAPHLLDRMLRLLVSHSLLTCTVLNHDHRVYGLAPASKLFVKNKDGGSLAPLLLIIQNHALIKSWYHLKDSILEGGELPFCKAHGENAVDYIGKDPKLTEVFRSSMLENNVLFMKKVLDTYKGFEGLRVLVDVGGGTGQILSMIVSKYPSIKGINFDLHHVIERSPPCSGVEHVGGDVFTSVRKGDAIFMKSIIHTWSDEQCLKLLKNCYEALPYEALPEYGKVIVVDLIAPTSLETNVATQGILQMEMFIANMMNATGKERTKEEFSALAREAGFAGINVACCAYGFSVVEFCK
ncbi:caffeic acid 3-O-methyltransferase-like isoform X1 [Telopea speciosissima]|uniref:caffeic acid 3-O-methyltransferase-like isoform X1 n=1 Tax=Telopea speciosissima TaxID=54955 RepID=UPI001CC6F66D|nr:caffeic acid 3-O-methyltransferase-like isoform X1 [Telopea speciosissima]